MTKTRVLALLSVIALLAALPLSVALAQQPPGIPSLIQGMAMLDGAAPPEGTMVVATVETETVGEDGEMMMEMMDIGMAEVMADGSFTLIVPDSGGKMVMFSLSMMMDGETMKYEAMSDPGEVMTVGGMDAMVDLEASTGMVPPTRTPVQVTDSMRGPRGPQGLPGEAGAAGEAGPAGSAGARGAVGPAGSAGADGAPGAAGSAGARGPAGSAGADGADGSGSAGARGPAGSAGPAGADGATGPAGPGGSAGADGGGGVLAIVALIIAIVGVVAAGGVFIAGRQSS